MRQSIGKRSRPLIGNIIAVQHQPAQACVVLQPPCNAHSPRVTQSVAVQVESLEVRVGDQSFSQCLCAGNVVQNANA